jgi:hypothetical protein
MYKAKQNFAFVGKTYFVGDEVPAHVAATVAPALTENLRAKKTNVITEEISEGEE